MTYWFGFCSAQTMKIIIVIPMFYIIKFFEDGPGLSVIPTSIDFYQFIACFVAIIIFGLSFIISVIGYSRKR